VILISVCNCLQKDVTHDVITGKEKEASAGELKGILGYADEQIDLY
jgi:hypothetical protein